MKKTRKMVASLVAIVICFAMLLGTTYAWFTDSVINTNNIIKSGNVDVELTHKSNGIGDYAVVDGTTKLFVNKSGNEILWEPGVSTTEEFQVKNVGTLALKYEFSIKALSKTLNAKEQSLLDVLKLTVNGNPADFGDTFEGTITAGGTPVTYEAKINWDSTANDNDYMNLKVLLGIELVATQFTVEEDGTGNQFDVDAAFPNVSSDATLVEDQEAVLETKGENSIKATLPAEVVKALKDAGVTSISLAHTDPVVENDKVIFESMEIVDQDGNIVDLEALNAGADVTITLPAQEVFAENEKVYIYHDGEEVATPTVGANGVISYEVEHLCEVIASKGVLVGTADELIEALENGKDVVLTNDIKINPANMSNAYGTTGINIKNGQSIYGAGHTIDIKGAGGTWDSGINTTGGLIKDLTVTGSFRGIFINHNSTHSEKVVLENVIIDGTTYTISCDQGLNQGLEATNCTFNGWTSFAATLGSAKFVDCYFGEGNGYAYCRPYAPTEFVGCEFEADYTLDARAEVTLENCTIGGVAITTDNLANLTSSSVTIK